MNQTTTNSITFEGIEDFYESIFDELRGIGNLGSEQKHGFHRSGWSDEESQAISVIEKHAHDLGLETYYDAVGNFYAITPGEGSIALSGSHLDTVAQGGLYDGAYGVVASLSAIKALQESSLTLSKRVGVVVWRCEESAEFGIAYVGSKSAIGVLDQKVLSYQSRSGRAITLEDAIQNQGFSAQSIKQAKPALNQATLEAITHIIEPHIEQGKVLETEEIDIGVVTSIRGAQRYEITITGKDSDYAVARTLVAIDKLHAAQNNPDIVQTVGVINIEGTSNTSLNECGITKVAGTAQLLVHGLDQDPRELRARIREEYNVTIATCENGKGLYFLFTGEFDHSGTTPMGPEYRRDANLALAYFVKEVTDQNQEISIEINNSTGNQTKLLLDIRASNRKQLSSYARQVSQTFRDLRSDGYRVHIKRLSVSNPVEELDSGIQQVIAQSADTLGLTYKHMPSGAGHDLAVIVNNCPIQGGMIFIPCKNGKSHSAVEDTKRRDRYNGVKVLAQTLYEITK